MRATVLGLMALTLISARAKEPHVPPVGPNLERITVTVGDLTLLLRQGTQWTPGRIDYRGTAMTTERSAYGTVFKFPGVGFIGTGHFENEPEDLRSVHFFLDGAPVAAATEALKGESFRFERESRVRDFSLRNTTELKDNRLYETATIETKMAVPLDLIYHFMHAWQPEISDFVAGTDGDEKITSGSFESTDEALGKFYIDAEVDWVAVYHPSSQKFAVSRLLETPDGLSHQSKLWNRPPTYRKYYLATFVNRTVPAGFEGTWRMVTAFGEASPLNWQAEAQALAEKLRE